MREHILTLHCVRNNVYCTLVHSRSHRRRRRRRAFKIVKLVIFNFMSSTEWVIYLSMEGFRTSCRSRLTVKCFHLRILYNIAKCANVNIFFLSPRVCQYVEPKLKCHQHCHTYIDANI